MGFLDLIKLIGKIPTVANLTLKLREAEAQNEILKSDLEQAKKQIADLTDRTKHLETPQHRPRPKIAEGTGSDPFDH